MTYIGVIGLGNIAKRHRANLKFLYPDATIVAMSASGREPESFVENADMLVSDMGELLALEPEQVIIASPASLHARHAESLIENGIPVLIEKPLESDFERATKLCRLLENTNSTAIVGYCLRYLPSSKIVKDQLLGGLIGKVLNVSINTGQFLPDWRPSVDYKSTVSAQKRLGGGVLLELSHELDYLSFILNEELAFCAGILRNSAELNLEVEEIADLLLMSESGVVCQLHMDFHQKRPRRSCTIVGSEGVIEWDLIANSVMLSERERERVIYSDPDWDKNRMYVDMLKEFKNAVLGKKATLAADVPGAANIVKLVEEIKLSAIAGVKV